MRAKKCDVRMVWNSSLDDWVEPCSYQSMALNVPLAWLEVASKLPRKATLQVALSLWWARTLGKRNPVRLTSSVVRVWGMDAETKRRALKDLEDACLVQVDRKRGRFPIVTILEGDDLCADEYPKGAA
jgi:hypothetical protein